MIEYLNFISHLIKKYLYILTINIILWSMYALFMHYRIILFAVLSFFVIMAFNLSLIPYYYSKPDVVETDKPNLSK